MGDTASIVVVGGGPAGLSAAIAAARQGAEVILLERGSACGSKNVMGGILYTSPLEELIPAPWNEGAPLERPVVRRSWSFLGSESDAAFSFADRRFSRPPYNSAFTVLRAPFDAWLAARAEEAGVQVYTGVVVDSLLWDGPGRVAGVWTRVEEGGDAEEGRLEARVVILAEGANTLLLEREGLRHKTVPSDVAVAVKEVLGLPAEAINARFALEGNEGEGREYYGESVKGMFGSGFIYTNRTSLSVGVAVSVKDLAAARVTPNDLLDAFKEHPTVRPLLEGAETLEYAAHMIPEGGYYRMGRLEADGLLVAGDAAGLVNVSPYHEGSNLAFASGIAAGRIAAEAVAAGDVSRQFLDLYRHRLADSFVLKDMVRFAGLPGFFRDNPQVLSRWPSVFLGMVGDLLDGSGAPKADLERKAWERFSREIGLFPFLVTAGKAAAAFGPSAPWSRESLSALASSPTVRSLMAELPDRVLDWLGTALDPDRGKKEG